MNFLESPDSVMFTFLKKVIYRRNIFSGRDIHRDEVIVRILERSAEHCTRSPIT